jgi:glycosyltransferase involved in cell wall biosynthesis
MKLGFDSKRLYCNFTGLGNYSRSLVKNLQKIYPENQYNLYTPKVKKTSETALFYENPSFQTYEAKTAFKSFWRSFSITNQLKKDKIDLYHGLSNEIPVNIKKSGIKSMVTIHDLIFKTLPETYPLIDKRIYDLKFRNSCVNADKIIAISNNTKQDIIRFYGIQPEKIEVIYQPCNPLFYDNIDNSESDNVLQNHNIPSEYILYVGSIEKRKNLKEIIEAYQYLQPEFRIPIVVVGGHKNELYKKELYGLIKANGLENKMIWVTDLKDNYSLKSIYQKATVFIYPSFYEGFGLPVAEALLSKTPVITANVSALPEVGGPASFYVDPNNPEELAHAITQVLSDTELRNTMINTGYEYAIQKFSPDRLTQQLMDCYKKTLHDK